MFKIVLGTENLRERSNPLMPDKLLKYFKQIVSLTFNKTFLTFRRNESKSIKGLNHRYFICFSLQHPKLYDNNEFLKSGGTLEREKQNFTKYFRK